MSKRRCLNLQRVSYIETKAVLRLTPQISEQVVATGSCFNTSSNVAGAAALPSGIKSAASSLAYWSCVITPKMALHAKLTI